MLAVSGEPGTVAKPAIAKVTAEVVGEGRGDKILVFHLKRKKQYKKLQGHRQNFTEVRIKAIEADGVTYTAAVQPAYSNGVRRTAGCTQGANGQGRGFGNGT